MFSLICKRLPNEHDNEIGKADKNIPMSLSGATRLEFQLPSVITDQ